MQDQSAAVALRYDPTEGNTAPRLVAGGRGYVADEILRVARENHVPIRQDPALAGALATLDVGSEIPPDLFRAVAEVLAFVYKMSAKS